MATIVVMALCGIVSRSSSVADALRAALAGLSRTNFGARRQFWSTPEHTHADNNWIDILNTKITAIEESTQELVKRPSPFPFTLKRENGVYKLERDFDLESIEIRATEIGYSNLKLAVTIRKPSLGSEALALKVDLDVYLGNLEISEFQIGNNSDIIKAGELDQDMKNCFMKYLKVRGIDKNNVAYLIRYKAAISLIESRDTDLFWMKNLRKFLKNKRM